MTELVARHTEVARVTMRGMFESATWPLRKLAWKIEEKVIWRVADAIRRRPTYTPAQAEAAPAAVPAESGERAFPRLRAPSRDVSIALATVAVAIGGGIGVATMLGNDGGAQRASAPASAASAPAASQPQSSINADAGPSTLQGVEPDFKPASKEAASGAAATTDAQVSPLQGTNAKPSSIPPGLAKNITAMKTARDFAGAFVLYEVGKSNAKVEQTFKRTATPALARALRDRPPRLPDSVQVPTAKVQNVVLGTPTGGEKKRQMDASVSLLRLGDLSELRLTLTLRHGAWFVSEVRG